MTIRLRATCLALASFVAGAAVYAQSTSSTSATQILDVPGGKIRVVTVASGLFHPWSLAFTPDGAVLVAERNGKLRVIRNGVLAPNPVWTSPTPPGQGGDALHGLAVHPKFAENRLVYVSYPKNGPKGNTLAISRGRLQGDKLTEIAEIFVADAWETSGNLAGHMMFGPDNTLYVMVGDRDRLCCTGVEDNSLRMKAQSLDNHVGKTLRLKDDGGVPADNPFVGKTGAKPEIFTYGHRNGYGLSFNPQTGELWQAEIGPMGGRRGQYSVSWPQLRLAARVDGPQLHRHARVGSTVVASRDGQPADVLGAVDQPVEHPLVHRRQVPALEGQSVRRRTDHEAVAPCRFQSAVAGGTPRAAAHAIERAHPGRAAKS